MPLNQDTECKFSEKFGRSHTLPPKSLTSTKISIKYFIFLFWWKIVIFLLSHSVCTAYLGYRLNYILLMMVHFSSPVVHKGVQIIPILLC